ncbi:MAG TPA: hypothetical protein VK081_06705 [Planctomycetota bacterium]|nr:hypothetical protein [Planctomycetota bacterium]
MTNKSNHDNDRFPSGPWTGFYLDPRQPGQHRTDLDLSFYRGKIAGSGSDKAGAFTITGRYSEDGEVRWSKSYAGHAVTYRGFREGKGIWGTWQLEDGGHVVRGGFHIWPQRAGEGIEENAEVAASDPAETLLNAGT